MKKKLYTLDELLELVGESKKDRLNKRYKQSLSNARGNENEERIVNDKSRKIEGFNSKFSLRNRIMKNPWVSSRPANQATSWLFKHVLQDSKTYKYDRSIMYQGGLFMFKYFNPKYKDTAQLPWFDKFPLVISLGPTVTNEGIRVIGFNLHLLPPKIRIVVLCNIFELHKRLYRYQVWKKSNKPVTIDYRKIINALKKYGVEFCVRMYIPKRQNQIVRFPITDWHKAVFIPSRGYDSIRAAQLIREWNKFTRAHGYVAKHNLDWKSHI